MMTVTLIMEPWMKLMISMGVEAMVLAAAVMVVASGPNMTHKSADALNATMSTCKTWEQRQHHQNVTTLQQAMHQ